MPFVATCAGCGHSSEVPDEFAGKRGTCRKCGAAMTLGERPAVPARVEVEAMPPAIYRPPVLAVAVRNGLVIASRVGSGVARLSAFLAARREESRRRPIEVIYTPGPVAVSCPYCAEPILPDAKKCRHCGEWLDPKLRKANARMNVPPPVAAPIVITNTNTARASSEQGRRRWSPAAAAVLSLVFPGLGQLYKGQPLNAILWFVLVVAGYFALIVPGLILHLLCVLGAASGDPYR